MKPKSISNGILNVQNIIRSKDGFIVIPFLHRYCNTYYVNIRFTINFTVENIFVHLYFFQIFLLLD